MEKPLVLSQGWDAFFKFPISPKGSGKAAWEKGIWAGKKIQLACHIRRFLILGVNQQLKKKKSPERSPKQGLSLHPLSPLATVYAVLTSDRVFSVTQRGCTCVGYVQ